MESMYWSEDRTDRCTLTMYGRGPWGKKTSGKEQVRVK